MPAKSLAFARLFGYNGVKEERGEFRRKFDSVVDDTKIARVLFDVSKNMLTHRSGTRTEDMYWIDGDTGEIVAKITDQSTEIEQEIVYTESVKKAIEGRKNLITLHTHPSSMPPSVEDFNAYFQNEYSISLVICHDGTIYQYQCFQRISIELFDLYMRRYIEEGYDDKDAQIKALTAMKRSYDFDFWEVL